VSLTRREFLESAALAAGGMVLAMNAGRGDAAGGRSGDPLRIAMCDWNLGKTCQVQALELARSIGLDGVEASVCFPGPGQHLRDPKVQREYLAAAKKYSIAIPSLALGILNGVPLASEPKAAIWLADAIEVARNLGVKAMLLAFFGRGELKIDDERAMTRLVDVLREAAPRAEKAGVILGLENTLSAEENILILQRVASPAVQVYYDPKNSADRGRDVPKEIRMLGDRICQVHVKNGNLLLSQPSNVDFAACGRALREIGYKGWYVLETASPKDLISDTRANIAYVRKTFA